MGGTPAGARPGDHRALLSVAVDDSSLVSAMRLARLLAPHGYLQRLAVLHRPGARAPLSPRQIATLAGRAPDLVGGLGALLDPGLLARFDLVHSAKFPWSFRERMEAPDRPGPARRPVFVSTFPGLEFLPGIGVPARASADVPCFNTAADLALAPAAARARGLRFSPLAYTERAAPPDPPGRVRRLVFFAQDALPLRRAGREAVARLLAGLAGAHPDLEVVVKLRHRAGENVAHTHRDHLPYPRLLRGVAGLTFEDGPAGAALARADAVLTCSSTAGIEALAAGVPAMFLTRYPGAGDEPQAAGIARVLGPSGLEVDAGRALRLEVPRADPDWWARTMSGPADLAALLAAVEAARRGAA